MSEIREAFTQRMTGDSFSALDVVNREDFPDDESYLRAATKIQLERSTPEYQRAYASLAAEYQKRQEVKQKEANEARYKELSRTVQLDSVELSNVDKKAREAAQKDLAAGRIAVADVG
jgi:BMFP domain-containing protein YqiC